MKLSKVIAKLKEMQDANGDIDLVIHIKNSEFEAHTPAKVIRIDTNSEYDTMLVKPRS